MAAILSIAVTSLSAGCAGHAETAPVSGQSTTADGSTEAVANLHESFDPARFREDLLLIQPVFTPPEIVVSAEPVAPAELVAPAVPTEEAAVKPEVEPSLRQVYRVQAIALSREAGARRIADQLARRFGVPVDVVSQGRLFAVRAGRYEDPVAAGQLKGQIAILSSEYAEAFVLADSVEADTTAVDVDSWLEFDTADSLAVADPPVFEPEMERFQGYRVLLGQFFSHDGSRDFRGKVMNRLKRDDVDIIFEQPWYKVLAGSFRTSSQAQQFAERCKRLGYRDATRVPAQVELPKLEEPER